MGSPVTITPDPSGPVTITPDAPADKPGFFKRMGQSMGIPTSLDEAKAAISPATLGGVPVAPPLSGLGMAINYGKNLVGKVRDFAQSPSIESGARAYFSTIPAGGSQMSFGEDVASGNYRGAAGTAAGIATQAALPELAERGAPTINRIVRAGGSGIAGAAGSVPILGPVGRGFLRGFGESWRGSAPVEAPAPPMQPPPQARPPIQAAPETPTPQAGRLVDAIREQPTSNMPTPASRAASDAAFSRNFPNEKFGGDMSPNLESLWQQSAGFEQPAEDIGAKVRSQMPSVPRNAPPPRLIEQMGGKAPEAQWPPAEPGGPYDAPVKARGGLGEQLDDKVVKERLIDQIRKSDTKWMAKERADRAARNSPAQSKGLLTGQVDEHGVPVNRGQGGPATNLPEDLTDILRKSVEMAKKKRNPSGE